MDVGRGIGSRKGADLRMTWTFHSTANMTPSDHLEFVY